MANHQNQPKLEPVKTESEVAQADTGANRVMGGLVQPEKEVKPVQNTPEKAAEPEKSEEEKPVSLDTLKKIDFQVVGRTFHDKKTQKLAVKWAFRMAGQNAAEVYAGSELVRVYTLKDHGADFAKLAEQLVEKKNSQII